MALAAVAVVVVVVVVAAAAVCSMFTDASAAEDIHLHTGQGIYRVTTNDVVKQIYW